MSMEHFISNTLLKYMKKGGALAILGVSVLLFADFYNVIKLENFPVPYLELGLWLYLIINAGIATPFHYLKESQNSACPRCGRALKAEPSFYCVKCGKIKFEE